MDATLKTAHQSFNKHLERNLRYEKAVEDEVACVRQRRHFLDRFGPSLLAGLDRDGLLDQIPNRPNRKDTMDYWLMYRTAHDFETKNFGSLGSKIHIFGCWLGRDGLWHAGPRKTVSQDEAVAILVKRRNQAIAAVNALQPFTEQAVRDLDPEVFQKAVEAAAPDYYHTAWLHKYLHLVFPNLVTWSATLAYSRAFLYRHACAPHGSGLYALDIRILQFLDRLPALKDVSVPTRYRLLLGGLPRDYWCLDILDRPSTADAMIQQGFIGLPPVQLGNLGKNFGMGGKREVTRSLKAACEEANLAVEDAVVRPLVELGTRLKSGHLVALLVGTDCLAVGRVLGDYVYAEGCEEPHRVRVEWLLTERFPLPPGFALRQRLQQLSDDTSALATIEAALIGAGRHYWHDSPNIFAVFDRLMADKRKSASEAILSEPEGLTAEFLPILRRKYQLILYGPPGTGKTYHAEVLARELIARDNFHKVPADLTPKERDLIDDGSDGFPYLRTCTFHPSMGYEEFIRGFRPKQSGGFDIVDGIFMQMAKQALENPDKSYVLIIDEINRGNLPKIFGELITLLEASRRGQTRVALAYGDNDSLMVPKNLYLIGTMNTADRSILLLDAGLRRRFAFREVMPRPEILNAARLGNVRLSTWLRALNRRVREHLGRDGRNLQIGHAYFLTPMGQTLAAGQIADIVRDEIWPLLQEYCYGDPEKLAFILDGERGIFDRNSGDLRHDLFCLNEDREPSVELELAMAAIIDMEDSEAEPEDDETDSDGSEA